MARLPEGGCSGRSAIGTGGAGFGFQAGGNVTEFVIILNTQAAVDAFARGGNVQFGGALSVAAGAGGRTAEAGVLPVAAVYTYSRSQGLFAGASLEGTILVSQSDKNAAYYRRRMTPEHDLTRPRGSAGERGAINCSIASVLIGDYACQKSGKPDRLISGRAINEAERPGPGILQRFFHSLSLGS